MDVMIGGMVLNGPDDGRANGFNILFLLESIHGEVVDGPDTITTDMGIVGLASGAGIDDLGCTYQHL